MEPKTKPSRTDFTGRGAAGNIEFHVSPESMTPQRRAWVPKGIVGRGLGWDVPGAVVKAFDFILPTEEAPEVPIDTCIN